VRERENCFCFTDTRSTAQSQKAHHLQKISERKREKAKGWVGRLKLGAAARCRGGMAALQRKKEIAYCNSASFL
jgi:hypothetical protein